MENNSCLKAWEVKEKIPYLLGNVSHRTVQETLQRDIYHVDYKCYRGQKRPLVNDEQRKMMLHSAKYTNLSFDKWCTVLWRNENPLSVSGGGSPKVCRHRDSNPSQTQVNHNTTIIQTQYKHNTNTIQPHYKHNTNTIQTIQPQYKHNTIISHQDMMA